jgi:import receptor subunit TOM22
LRRSSRTLYANLDRQRRETVCLRVSKTSWAMSAVQSNASDKMLARAEELWEHPKTQKARRVGYHVVRGAKKFVVGTGGAAWVVGTTMLVMVMPLVFEIDREQQSLEYEAAMGAGPK